MAMGFCQFMLMPLDRLDRCLGGDDAGGVLFRGLVGFGRHVEILEQQRQCDAGQDQRQDDDPGGQEDGKIARREGRAVVERERQGEHTGKGDGAAHPGEGGRRHQPPVGPARAIDAAILVAQDGEAQRQPHPEEAQRSQTDDDRHRVECQPAGFGMAGQCHRALRFGKNAGQLFAQQHEDDAVQGELDRVPHRIAAHPGFGHRLARDFGEGHGHAGGDGGQDAGGMDMFGQDIGAEGDQQADQDLRPGFLAPTARDPGLGARHDQRDPDADRDAGKGEPEEVECSIAGGEAAGQRRSNGEAQADQAGCVVEQRFPFEDMHHALGNGHARGDGGHGDRIGRRDHGGEGEGDGERHRRDHPVDEEAHADDGGQHQPQRQLDHGRGVLEQFILGNAPAVEEQQRRQEQEQEYFGIERDPVRCRQADDRAKGDLDQRCRDGNRHHARQGTTDDDSQQQE